MDNEVDKFVLASLTLSPIKDDARITDIGCEWQSINYSNERPVCPNAQTPDIMKLYLDEMERFQEREDKNQELAIEDVRKSLERLVEKGLIKIVAGKDNNEYHAINS